MLIVSTDAFCAASVKYQLLDLAPVMAASSTPVLPCSLRSCTNQAATGCLTCSMYWCTVHLPPVNLCYCGKPRLPLAEWEMEGEAPWIFQQFFRPSPHEAEFVIRWTCGKCKMVFPSYGSCENHYFTAH
jgi:hypothetical protein